MSGRPRTSLSSRATGSPLTSPPDASRTLVPPLNHHRGQNATLKSSTRSDTCDFTTVDPDDAVRSAGRTVPLPSTCLRATANIKHLIIQTRSPLDMKNMRGHDPQTRFSSDQLSFPPPTIPGQFRPDRTVSVSATSRRLSPTVPHHRHTNDRALLPPLKGTGSCRLGRTVSVSATTLPLRATLPSRTRAPTLLPSTARRCSLRDLPPTKPIHCRRGRTRGISGTTRGQQLAQIRRASGNALPSGPCRSQAQQWSLSELCGQHL